MPEFLPLIALLPYPEIDPVIFEIGPLAIRWYSLAYLLGLLAGWRYIHWLNRRPPRAMTTTGVDDLLVWMMLGIVFGGRLGYVLFYNPAFYLANPVEIFMLQEGGMSFHGGLLGVVAAEILFARRHGIRLLALADLVAAAAPIGLFLGRLANFINGELYGRASDVAWAMVFPRGGTASRHPSQLYEALLEGLVIFVVLFLLARRQRIRARPGIVAGGFLVLYGAARIVVELFREPDAHIGQIAGFLTMGQILSLPVLLAGVALIAVALRGTPFTGREPETAGKDRKTAGK